MKFQSGIEVQIDQMLPVLRNLANEQDAVIDVNYIENNVLIQTSKVSDKLLYFYCKERAINDMLMVLH